MNSGGVEKGRSRMGGVAAILAGIVVVTGVSLLPRTEQGAVAQTSTGPRADLTELARLEPPAYFAPSRNSAETAEETLFREAMEAYLRRDYPRAIAGLREVLDAAPMASAPRFFLGVSELLIGRTAEGMVDLGQVAVSDSAFAEEARFDLAKGCLMLGRRPEALVLLRLVESRGGDFAARARSLIDRIGIAE